MAFPSVNADELTAWSKYIRELCGVYLDQTKGYLLETRLGGLVRESGCGTFSDFYAKVKTDLTGVLRRKIIDLITTNETSFFRDSAPFEMLQHKILPDLVDSRNKTGLRPVPIRIWSAACSTGQEVFTAAIVIRELFADLYNYDIRILGTDISDKAVARASYGAYSKLEIERGMPPGKVSRYFMVEGERWKIRDEIRAMASFRTMNLMEPFSFPTPFDIIFCRNVAIYFREPDRLRMFKNICRHLAKDGYLIIGSTESITGLCPELEPKRHLRSVFYQFKTSS